MAGNAGFENKKSTSYQSSDLSRRGGEWKLCKIIVHLLQVLPLQFSLPNPSHVGRALQSPDPNLPETLQAWSTQVPPVHLKLSAPTRCLVKLVEWRGVCRPGICGKGLVTAWRCHSSAALSRNTRGPFRPSIPSATPAADKDNAGRLFHYVRGIMTCRPSTGTDQQNRSLEKCWRALCCCCFYVGM